MINSRLADTVVVVPDAQTVIIGGLMENQMTMSESKVPVLGDIPWLGNAFKRKQKQNTKTELMIFLTPFIVPAASQLASLTAQERALATLKPKSVSEAELERVLNNLPTKGTSDKAPTTPTPTTTTGGTNAAPTATAPGTPAAKGLYQRRP